MEKAKKKAKRTALKLLWKVFKVCVVFCAGAMVGIHRNVIKAKIKGEPLPPSPHSWCSANK